MQPYMGLLHTALSTELAEFIQGTEDADQALADVKAAYDAAAKEGGFLKPAPTGRRPLGWRPILYQQRSGGSGVPHKTFLAFIFPSLVAMLLFIAFPIVSVAFQSLYVEHQQVLVNRELSAFRWLQQGDASRHRAATRR